MNIQKLSEEYPIVICSIISVFCIAVTVGIWKLPSTSSKKTSGFKPLQFALSILVGCIAVCIIVLGFIYARTLFKNTNLDIAKWMWLLWVIAPIIVLILLFRFVGFKWIKSIKWPKDWKKPSKTFWKWMTGIIGACVVGTLLYLNRKELPHYGTTIWRYLSVEWMPWSAIVAGTAVLLLVIWFFGKKAFGEFLLKAATACLILGGIWLIIDRMSGCAQRLPAPQQWGVASSKGSSSPASPTVDRITVNGSAWTAIHRNNWAGVVMDVEPEKVVTGMVVDNDHQAYYFTIERDTYRETTEIPDRLKRGTWYFKSGGKYPTVITFTK